PHPPPRRRRARPHPLRRHRRLRPLPREGSTPMTEAITGMLMIVGALFALLAAVCIIRMPDLCTRMQAATEPGTLAAGLTAAGVAVYFSEVHVTAHALLIIAFFFLTAPIAAHLIGRAAYFVGVPLWKQTAIDDLHGQYD